MWVRGFDVVTDLLPLQFAEQDSKYLSLQQLFLARRRELTIILMLQRQSAGLDKGLLQCSIFCLASFSCVLRGLALLGNAGRSRR